MFEILNVKIQVQVTNSNYDPFSFLVNFEKELVT